MRQLHRILSNLVFKKKRRALGDDKESRSKRRGIVSFVVASRGKKKWRKGKRTPFSFSNQA